MGLAHVADDDHLLRGRREGLDLLSVDQVSTQSSCACTVAPPAAAAPSLDSAAAAAPIRWDTGVRGTGVGSIAKPRVQLLAVCGRDEQIGRGERAPNLMEVY